MISFSTNLSFLKLKNHLQHFNGFCRSRDFWAKIDRNSLSKLSLSTYKFSCKTPPFCSKCDNMLHKSCISDISVRWGVSAKNKIDSNGNWTHNTNHHWTRSLMLIQLCQSVISWQDQMAKPSYSHAQLNLEIIQAQKVKWCKVLFKDLLFNTCLGGRGE